MINVFEKVYAITLPRRPDRWKTFQEKLPQNWPFKKPEKFNAIDGGVATMPPWWTSGPGAWGCYRSHMRIIEDCLNDNVNSVFILEDDAVCVESFSEKVNEFWKNLPEDWEMVYFGGEHVSQEVRVPRKVNEWVYEPHNVIRTHGYGLRGRRILEIVYQLLQDYFSWTTLHHIDYRLCDLHRTMEHGLYVPKEWLVAQADGKSDIFFENFEYRIFPGAEEIVYPKVDILKWSQ